MFIYKASGPPWPYYSNLLTEAAMRLATIGIQINDTSLRWASVSPSMYR